MIKQTDNTFISLELNATIQPTSVYYQAKKSKAFHEKYIHLTTQEDVDMELTYTWLMQEQLQI